jgi:phage-related minor tail protein
MNIGKWGTGVIPFFLIQRHIDKIRHAMEELRNIIKRLLEAVKKILDGALPVLSLVTRAFDWVNLVSAPVNEIKGTAATHVINLANWGGPARTAYDNRLPQQTEGIATYADAASEIGSWLVELASAAAAYLVALVKPLFDIAGTLGAAAVDAGSVAGALEAIGKCAELVQVAATTMWEQLDAAVNVGMTVVQKLVNEKQILAKLGSGWPQMVTV